MDERRNVAFRFPPLRDIGVPYPLDLTRNKRLFLLLQGGITHPAKSVNKNVELKK
jgi:hypothetical protein